MGKSELLKDDLAGAWMANYKRICADPANPDLIFDLGDICFEMNIAGEGGRDKAERATQTVVVPNQVTILEEPRQMIGRGIP